MMMNSDNYKSKQRPDKDSGKNPHEKKYLNLYQVFAFVIKHLVKICKHDKLQAEQCAFITHYNGKCDVKVGNYEYLSSIRDALAGKGLNVTIE
jgi:ATP-dependent Clp protease adaptor protein ClpS